MAKQGFNTILAHGNEKSIYSGTTVADVQMGVAKTADLKPMSVKKLAETLRTSEGFEPNLPVLSLACNVGNGPYMQGLANELNVPVYASTGLGVRRPTAVNQDLNNTYRLTHSRDLSTDVPAEFKVFYPDGKTAKDFPMTPIDIYRQKVS